MKIHSECQQLISFSIPAPTKGAVKTAPDFLIYAIASIPAESESHFYE